MWLGGIWTGKKPENNYVKLYNSASFWDTLTKVGSKYSLRRPLSETPVILNFGRIFRLQNGRRREVALVFLQRCDTEQVQYKGIVYTRIINMWLGRIWTGEKPENNYVKLYNSASFWDTLTKVGSKYSLGRPLSETPVILNFGRIFRLQNGRRREVALVFLQRCDTEQVLYKGIVYTRIINMWLGGIWTGKKPENNYVKLYDSASFWDTLTKVRSKYSLRRPLSVTPVILNFGRIFRLQNGRRREVALVFLQRCDTEQVQYKRDCVHTHYTYMAGKDLNGKKSLKIIMSSCITQQVFEIQ